MKFDNTAQECPSCRSKPKLLEDYQDFKPAPDRSCGGYKPDFFAELAKIEANNFWFTSRNLLITWAFKRYFAEAKNFFEIGCGTGFVLSCIKETFPTLSLYGSDIYAEGLHYAKKRLGNIEFFQMDAREVPFENEFDTIGLFDLLEHIDDDELVLSQIYKALRNDGGVMLTVPQHTFLWSQIDEEACHLRRYNRQKLKSKVERAGFKTVDIISFVSLLLPIMMVSRLRKKSLNKKLSVLSELKLDTLTNAMLKRLMDAERLLIRFGVRPPLGGSLLLVAYKT